MISLAPLNAAEPEPLVQEVVEQEAAIRVGTLHPFQGPSTNQAGEMMVPEASTMTDAELLKIEWYVEGVQGQLPK